MRQKIAPLYFSIPGLAWRLKKAVKMSVRILHNGFQNTSGYLLNSSPVLTKKHTPKLCNGALNAKQIFKLMQIRRLTCLHPTFFSYLSYVKV